MKFGMTTRHKIVFWSLHAAHAQNFLLMIHVDGSYQHMSPIKYHTITWHRVMILLLSIDEIYLVFRKALLYTFGEHTIRCKKFPDFKYKRDFVTDVLFDIFRWTWVSVKKETPMNFLIDPQEGRSALRQACSGVRDG